MTTAGVIFFWAAIVCLFCAVALGIASRKTCHPYRASSDTARLVDGKMTVTPPVETRGCR